MWVISRFDDSPSTVRAGLNAAVKQRIIPWNPCNSVELPAEGHEDPQVYGLEEVSLFLEASASHRLGLAYRMVLLRGFRRGEVLGLRWTDVHEDGAHVDVVQTILQLGGKVIIDTPKSRTSRRTVSLDAETARLLSKHQDAQRRQRFRAGSAYDDHGLIFADEIGRGYRPDWASREFKRLARLASLPPSGLPRRPLTSEERVQEAVPPGTAGVHMVANAGLEPGQEAVQPARPGLRDTPRPKQVSPRIGRGDPGQPGRTG